MVNEFCGFKHGVIGKDKMPADTTLNNMKKADLIKLLHTAQHNYESLMWFYNNAVKANMSQLNNNGWIPCSERLPETNESVLCWAKSTARGGDVCFVGSCHNGFWFLQSSADTHSFPGQYVIVAWQPLPQPFVRKDD